jgi:spore coat protein CotH
VPFKAINAIALTTAAAIALAGPCAGQTAADFYSDSVLHEIHLDVHPNDWRQLQENYLDNTYYPANFRWRDISIPDVGIRSRGRGSRSPLKPNLRVDFNRFEDGQKFLGLKSFNLKANNQDASMMRERISMLLFDRMGIATPREAYARVFVNGTFFGLYNIVESIDKDFLKRVFGEDEGYLYEWKPFGVDPGYRFQYLGPEPELYSPAMFDPVTHEKDPDPKPLVEMIAAINQSSDAEFVDAVGAYLDLARFTRFIAVEAYLAEHDGVLGDTFGMNNFHFYRFTGGKRHIFIPWDKDNSFDHPLREITTGVNDNVLSRRLLAIPEYRQLFLSAVLEASTMMGGAEGLIEQSISRFYEQMGEAARQDPYKQCPVIGNPSCGPAEFEAGVAYLREFAQVRGEEVIRQAYERGYIPPASAGAGSLTAARSYR